MDYSLLNKQGSKVLKHCLKEELIQDSELPEALTKLRSPRFAWIGLVLALATAAGAAAVACRTCRHPGSVAYEGLPNTAL